MHPWILLMYTNKTININLNACVYTSSINNNKILVDSLKFILCGFNIEVYKQI